MISNVHGYPIRLFTALTICGQAGALIIESRDRVQVNHCGKVILIAECREDGWLVDMTGSPSSSDNNPEKSEDKC